MAPTRARRSGWAWQWIAALVMLAFTFQSYVAQTHVHKPATTVLAGLVHHSGHNKSPAQNSPFDCSFCQVVNHAGSMLVSDTALLLLTAQWVEMLAPRHLLPDTGRIANHHWRSRAPPSP